MKRQVVLAAVGVLIVALASFSLFNALGSQTGSPNPQAATPVSSFTPPPVYPSTPDFSRPTPTSLPPPVFTPWYTPLPIPTLPPTPSPVPSPIPPSPTPVRVISAWQTYTNATYSYSITYPDTWFLQAYSPNSVFITSFQLRPSGGGGIPSGSVKIDVLVSAQNLPTGLPQGTSFCVQGSCGTRVDQQGPFSEPAGLGLNRMVYIQIPKAGSYYGITALIADPLNIAQANSSTVDRIIASFRFTQP